ncbi:glycoprotein precursor [Pena Blanca virus]|uniref:Envelopment polyprotein n=1 Tax=Pena Blanca virus TaxID=2559112 RepID=A0A482KAR6_9VIRU|nr:glycoprotein precursor [Pena Blanca virus]QBQ01760.1 glycoprotein precursor [Pena Blanca virus]
MYKLLWSIAALSVATQRVFCLYKFSKKTGVEMDESCLSNEVPVSLLQKKWDEMYTADDEMLCNIGLEKNSRRSSRLDVTKFIQLIQESPAKLSFSCIPIHEPSVELTLTFDGLANTDQGSLLVSCKDGSTLEDLSKSDVELQNLKNEILAHIESKKLSESRSRQAEKEISQLKKDLTETLSVQDRLIESESLLTQKLKEVTLSMNLDKTRMEGEKAGLIKSIADQEEMIKKLEDEIKSLKVIRGDLRALAEKRKVQMEESHKTASDQLEVLKSEKERIEQSNANQAEELSKMKSHLESVRKDLQISQMAESDLKAKLGEMLANKVEDIKINKEKSKDRETEPAEEIEESHSTSKSYKASGGSISSTMLPIIASIMLLSGSLAAEMNTWEHSLNRPGAKLDYKLNNDDEASCSSLDYGSDCPGFNLLLNTTQYPFFNAHVHKYSALEALADGILSQDSSGSCSLTSGTVDKKCIEQKALLKSYCPKAFKSAHYIDDYGKIRSISCPNEHELSPDCVFCHKITGSQVKKSSVSMQDVVCQKGSETLKGKEPASRIFCSIGRKIYKKCGATVTQHETVPFVVFNDGPKIYLDRLVIKNEEILNAGAFMCFDYKGQMGGSDQNSGTSAVKKSVRVTECKTVDNTKNKHCTGDAHFCMWKSCVHNFPNVYCMVSPGSGPIRVHINGQWQTPKCVGYEQVRTTREIRSSVIENEKPCEECIAECKEEGIIVKTTGKHVSTAMACSSGYCASITQNPSPQVVVPYPGGSHLTGGGIAIHASTSDQEPGFSMMVYCPSHNPCKLINCWFCVDNLLNFHCHTILSSLSVALIISLSSYIIFMLLFYCLRTMRIIPSYVRSPLTWLLKLCKWLYGRALSKARDKFLRISANIGHDVEAAQDIPQRNLRPLPRNYVRIVTGLSLLCLVAACSENEVSNSKMTRCRVDGQKTICKFNGVVNLKAGIIGSESCLILKGNADGQHNMIRIKTVSSESLCREGSSFWTNQFSPVCFSSRRCHLMSECQKENCANWNSSVVSKEFSGLSDTNVMAENRCFEQCGGIGCSCFNVNPSCLFVHTRLKPVRREAVRVFNCMDWQHKIVLEVKSPDGNVERVSLSSLESKFFPWGSISLSLDAESISGSNSITFLQSSQGGFALIDENFPEQPRKGFIGEVRCSSESAASTAHTSCIMAPSLIDYSPHRDSIDCTTSLLDPYAAFLRGSLPQSRNGKTYSNSMDKRTVQALSNSAVNANYVLTIDDYDVEFQDNTANCDVAFINITGCYSCNVGARACFSMKSSAESELIIKNDDNSITFGFTVGTSKATKCQIVHFNEPVVDMMLKYSCGSSEKIIKLSGHLVASSMTNDFVQSGGSVVVNPKPSEFNLLSILSGFTSWMGGPVKAILVTILYLIVGIIMALLVVGLVKRFTKWAFDFMLKKTE